MPRKSLNDFAAISFDIGGTLIEPFVLPALAIHKKFIHQVCGTSFSDEKLHSLKNVTKSQPICTAKKEDSKNQS